MMKSLFLAFLLLAHLAACVPYVLVEGNHTESSENFEVDLPQGWRIHHLAFDQQPMSRVMLEKLQQWRDLRRDIIRITKDGLLLQQISIGRIGFDDEFPHTKKKLSKGLLPHEAAEVIIDNLRSNPNLMNQRVSENAPAKLAGQPGFKLLYSYQTKDGLKVKGAYYGAMIGEWCYYLYYEAPERYYFARDYPIFEKIKESFRLLKADTA